MTYIPDTRPRIRYVTGHRWIGRETFVDLAPHLIKDLPKVYAYLCIVSARGIEKVYPPK